MNTHNKKQTKNLSGVYFGIIVLLLYGVLFLCYPQNIQQAL